MVRAIVFLVLLGCFAGAWADGVATCVRVMALRDSPYFTGHAQLVYHLTDAICTHVKLRSPVDPLIISLHGSPGTGKSLFHQLVAEALFDQPHNLPFLDPPNHKIASVLASPFKNKKYVVIKGAKFSSSTRQEQINTLEAKLADAVSFTIWGWIGRLFGVQPATPLIAIEDVDKLDCHLRQFFKHAITGSLVNGKSLGRAIIILETNEGQATLIKMAETSTIDWDEAEETVKGELMTSWCDLNTFPGGDPCPGSAAQQATDVAKMVARISYFVPFFPYKLEDLSSIIAAWFSVVNERLIRDQHGSLIIDSTVTNRMLSLVTLENGLAKQGATQPRLAMTSVMHTIDAWKSGLKMRQQTCKGVLKYMKTHGINRFVIVDVKGSCVARGQEL